MYSYTYDEETGGILLNSTPTVFSKEPRPVYAPELDLLGFDKYWKYDKQSDAPPICGQSPFNIGIEESRWLNLKAVTFMKRRR